MESGAALVIARWVFFSSAMTAFGGALFSLYTPQPSRGGEGVIRFQPLRDHAVRGFRHTVFLEQALGLAVLLAASVLGLTAPTAF